MANKTNNKTIRFAMCKRMYQGATPSASFTFDAIDTADASRKAFDWAQYHGMSYYTDEVNSSRSDVTVREATGTELDWTPSNEYV